VLLAYVEQHRPGANVAMKRSEQKLPANHSACIRSQSRMARRINLKVVQCDQIPVIATPIMFLVKK
jgi:hypothetical protein